MSPRTPVEARPPRMQPLARLPVFFALAGKRAVIAGGTPAAAWKAELLAAAGADVHVFAAAMSDEVRGVAADPPAGRITLHPRAWETGDLRDTCMAIGAFDDDADAARFAAVARSAGVPVNVIDKPAFCDFSFGTIVNRSPLVIGVSTDGSAPVFAQAIRAKIEALIPFGFARWAQAARRWRQAVRSSGMPFAARTRFWQLFTAKAVANPNREPDEADFDGLMAATQRESAASQRGSVTLVGAGPGDPELLTLRAIRALQSADVILIDDLVAPAILDFARREAKKMMVGKTGFAPSCKQDDINATMIALAKAGKRVVRLKGGDPMIFGRANEEIAACAAAGIAVDVVPGISAAQGAAARLGISLTHRKLARRVQYVTGHGADGKLPKDIDWQGLADPATTTVVYMPKRSLAALVAAGVTHGLALATPAVAVIAATQPDQEVIAGTIADVTARLDAAAPTRPVILMIGRAMVQAANAGCQPLMPAEAGIQRLCTVDPPGSPLSRGRAG